MKLTDNQQRFALAKLNQKRKSKICVACEEPAPVIMLQPYELRAYEGGMLRLGGSSVLPVIPVMCENCGYVQLFSAIKLGIIDTITGVFLDE